MNIDLSDFLPFGSISPKKRDDAPAKPTVRRRRTMTGNRSRTADPADQPSASEGTVRITLDLPRTMLVSLQAKAGCEDVGDVIRATLQAAGNDPEAGTRQTP